MKAGDPHGAHLSVPALLSVPEGLHTASDTATGFYYGHLVVQEDTQATHFKYPLGKQSLTAMTESLFPHYK